jgi:2-C-methyl-D-erythritol 4-phosphate cytidylyltransferase
MSTLDAVLLGGGLGSRFSTDGKKEPLPKQFLEIGTTPVFIYALKSLLSMDCFRQIVITVPSAYIILAEELLDTHIPKQSKTLIRVVPGGKRRQDSSCLALEALEELSPPPTRILIHDACRPYISREFLKNIKEKLLDRSYGAWVPVVPIVETLKKIENHQVIETVERSLIHRVQTPQIFEFTVIRPLIEKLKQVPELTFTDDASICEYYGIPVGTFEGDLRNIKLTYEFEKETLRSILTDPTKESSCAPELVTTFTA